MTAEEYIKAAERKNPALFAAAKVEISPSSLRAVIRAAHSAGFDHAELHRALREACSRGEGREKCPRGEVPSVFEQMFGRP